MDDFTSPDTDPGVEPGFQLDRRGSDREPLPASDGGDVGRPSLAPGPELLEGSALFLAEASAVLASSLDYEATLATVARLTVPFLADFCIVDVLDERGTVIRRVATAHADPRRDEFAARVRDYPPALAGPSLVARVIRSGRAERLPAVDPEHLGRDVGGRKAFTELLRRLGPTSAMCVPLVAHGEVGGALLLVATERTGRRFTPAHQVVAEELARRAALAVDNARLYAAERGARLRAERLRSATVAFAEALTVDDVVRVALRAARDAMGAHAGSVWLIDAEARGPVLRQALQEGFPAEAVAADVLPLGRPTPLAEAVHRAEPFVVPSPAWWRAHYDTPLPLAMQHGTRALATLPMGFGGRMLGVIALGFAEERAVDLDALTVGHTLATQAAQSLERARLLDVAERARCEAEAALEVAERASRAKSEFLAVVSHELRTPLNAIAGYVQLLEMELRGPLTDLQREDLQRIRRAQGALRVLIDDVLDFSKLEAGRMEYEIEAVSLHEALATTEAVIAPLASGRGLDLAIGDAGDARAAADPRRLQQVLLNLLTNAVKFTAEGGRVAVTCDPGDEQVVLRVSDTGQGIAAAELARVFEPFEQGARGLTRDTTGVGLGLAISRRLAEAMGGGLEIESSVPGQGSTFRLVLPRG